MAVVKLAPRRGEVWICALDPTVGKEIRKARPCLVVTPDDLNERVGMIGIVPLTSGSWPASFHVETKFDGKAGRLVPEQLRGLDRSRFIKCMGVLDRKAFLMTLAVLREMFEE